MIRKIFETELGYMNFIEKYEKLRLRTEEVLLFYVREKYFLPQKCKLKILNINFQKDHIVFRVKETWKFSNSKNSVDNIWNDKIPSNLLWSDDPFQDAHKLIIIQRDDERKRKYEQSSD